MRLLLILLLTISFGAASFAQIDRVYDPSQDQITKDTLTELDTLINENGFFSLFQGKPGRAAFYSLVFPGGGQIYNRKWLKVPLALGIEGYTIFNIYNTTRLYKQAQKNYVLLLGSGEDSRRAKAVRDIYRKRREFSWVIFAGGHLITIVDAYVDRHLMGFDVSNDLSLVPYQEFFYADLSTGISLKINLNRPIKLKEKPIVYP